jgi:uncharacterized MnhB-related membrane protein
VRAALAVLLLLAAGLSGLLVVLTRDPRWQVFATLANGMVLALLFEVLQAPDVALSELVIGAVVTPLLFLAALAAITLDRRDRKAGR